MIEEVEEQKEQDEFLPKENEPLEIETRPKSKTKDEKDRENILSRAEIIKRSISDTNLEPKKLKDIENNNKAEKELILESTCISSSYSIESEATISSRSEKIVQNTLDKIETKDDCNAEEDRYTENNKVSPTSKEMKPSDNDMVNESAVDSDDGQVVVTSAADLTGKGMPEEEGKVKQSRKRTQDETQKRKNNGTNGKGSSKERPRGNIPSSTGRSILRSHSGTWRKFGRKQKQSKETINTDLPPEEPFKPNIDDQAEEQSPKNDDKIIELPRLPVEHLSTSSSTPIRNRSPSSPPLPPVSTAGTPTSQPGSTRVSRSIESVISRLDRRSMSVLPQIGKNSPDGSASSRIIFSHTLDF